MKGISYSDRILKIAILDARVRSGFHWKHTAH